MSTPQLDRLREHCYQLRLYQIERELTARLEQAAKKETSYADFLDQLVACEADAKTYKHHQMRIAMARFPYQKTRESFDSVQLCIVRSCCLSSSKSASASSLIVILTVHHSTLRSKTLGSYSLLHLPRSDDAFE